MRSLLTLFIALPVTALATDFGADGPEAYSTKSFQSIALSGNTTLQAEIYYPQAAGARPAIVVTHGFASDRFTMAIVGKHLASWGFVAVVPNMPSTFSPDGPRNAALTLEILETWLPAKNADAGSFLAGRIDTQRIGATGLSAGGLSSLLAAADFPSDRRTAAVMLDWVDSQSAQGTAAAPRVSAPAAFLYAEPSSCNANNNGVAPSTAVTGPYLQLKVVRAVHCDPGDAGAFACILSCGRVDESRQRLFRGYMTAWFRRYLLDDPASEPWLGGATFQADLAAGRTAAGATARIVPVGFVEPVDAGTPVVDAGNAADSGTPEDAGTTFADAGEGPPDAGTPSDAGLVVDAGLAFDAGNSADAGTPTDAGNGSGTPGDSDLGGGGCDCNSGQWSLVALSALAVRWRRKR